MEGLENLENMENMDVIVEFLSQRLWSYRNYIVFIIPIQEDISNYGNV